MTKRPFIRSRLAALMMIAMPWLLAGCSQLTYDNLKLREAPTDYERKLPAEQSRRTSVGIAYYTASANRAEAIVILRSNDGRVAGRMLATRSDPNKWMRQGSQYSLVGELDPELLDLRSVGPIDALRLITQSLTEYRGEKLATDAHDLVCAGLVRLLQRWPRAEDVGARSERLPRLFELAPGTGEAIVAVDANGVYHFEYRLSPKR
ncbi:MAG: hypothetical protein ACKVS9_10770 [Phycisphaerae bacterium]